MVTLGLFLAAASALMPKFSEIPAMRTEAGKVVFDRSWAGGDGRCYSAARIDLNPYLGKCVIVRGTYSSDKTGLGTNRVKFMVSFRDGQTGEMKYYDMPKVPVVTETNAVAAVFVPLEDVVKVSDACISVGLYRDGPGRISFDTNSIAIQEAPPIVPWINRDYRIAYPDRVANRAPMRGFMLGNNLKPDDYADLAATGANLVRFQLHETRSDGDMPFDMWLEKRLAYFEKTLVPAARQFGLKVIVDLHSSPGGRLISKEYASTCSPKLFNDFVSAWEKIATRCRPFSDVLYGYDLQNEPVQRIPRTKGCDYWTLQRMAAEAVRRIDPSTTIIVEAAEWDAPSAYVRFPPLKMDNVIYQVHVYVPGEYTHQGVNTDQGIAADRNIKSGKCWPDARRKWDRELIRKSVRPVVEFQRRHGARILVGEFSAVAWAPGAENYLADVIAVCEENGWDWTYHAFRESICWSAEHVPTGRFDAARKWPELAVDRDNPRYRLLLNAFRKNNKGEKEK